MVFVSMEFFSLSLFPRSRKLESGWVMKGLSQFQIMFFGIIAAAMFSISLVSFFSFLMEQKIVEHNEMIIIVHGISFDPHLPPHLQMQKYFSTTMFLLLQCCLTVCNK